MRRWPWPWREASTLAYPWLETGGRGAGSPGTAEPVAQVCRLGGHVRGPGSGRASLGCWAGGWQLAPSWFPGRGGSTARLRLHWGPAAPRGAMTSAPGALCARSRARTRCRHAEAAGQPRGFPWDPQRAPWGAETGKASEGDKESGEWASRISEKTTLSWKGFLVITHCADKETEAWDTASRTPSVWQCCLDPQFRIHLFTHGLWVVT